jgi:hypothetical protein
METIVVSKAEFVGLLVKANVTDPARWPEGLKEGAALLARIREIEAACKKEHGQWDWELISEELQDEYDDTVALLSQLRRALDPEPDVDGEALFAELEQPVR